MVENHIHNHHNKEETLQKLQLLDETNIIVKEWEFQFT